MPTRPQKFYRHSIRLPDYDYSQPGFYYVTICVRDKKLMFGEIANGEIYLNEVRPDFAWQEDYYEHIVRNDKDLERIRKYIFDNPAQWESDRFYA